MPSGLTAISASECAAHRSVEGAPPFGGVDLPSSPWQQLFVALAAAACTYGIDIYSISGSARSPPWGTPSVAQTSR